MPSPLSSSFQSPLPIHHYENFPVASWLCPSHLRAPVAAIYHFARTADDIADEGDASAETRLRDLAAYRRDLDVASGGGAVSTRWPQVFEPLAHAIAQFNLPVPLLADLLSAFEQDVARSRDRAVYASQSELLDYCRRSANPVGRLLLHLYGFQDEESLAYSDHICSALQLINFWQDLSVDIPNGRFYLPQVDCNAHGVDPRARMPTAGTNQLIAGLAQAAKQRMLAGTPLVHRLPGRAGWELRWVVQGGLRILDKLDAIHHASLQVRPTVGKRDLPIMFWRALWL